MFGGKMRFPSLSPASLPVLHHCCLCPGCRDKQRPEDQDQLPLTSQFPQGKLEMGANRQSQKPLQLLESSGPWRPQNSRRDLGSPKMIPLPAFPVILTLPGQGCAAERSQWNRFIRHQVRERLSAPSCSSPCSWKANSPRNSIQMVKESKCRNARTEGTGTSQFGIASIPHHQFLPQL